MKKLFTFLLIVITINASAQQTKFSLIAGANYGIISNNNLQNHLGRNLGIQYDYGKKSAIMLNYTTLHYRVKSSNSVGVTNTNYLTFGYKYYVNKKKTFYVTSEFGTEMRSRKFAPVAVFGFGYEKQLTKKLSIDFGTNMYAAKSSINALNWMVNTTLKWKL